MAAYFRLRVAAEVRCGTDTSTTSARGRQGAGKGSGRRVGVRTIQMWRRASVAWKRRRRVSPGSEIGVWDKGSGWAPVDDLLGRFR